MRLKKFKSHEHYVEVQRRTACRRGPGPYFTDAEIERIARWLKSRGVDGPLRGICHGARAGLEADEIVKHFPAADVFGTDLFPYSGKSDRHPGESKVVEWDFSERRSEWIGAFDLIYSNSLDHARDPEGTVAVWMEQLKPGGHLCVQWTASDVKACSGDCFGATLWEYVQLMNSHGRVIDLLYNNVPRGKGRLRRKSLESVVIVAGRGKGIK